MSLQTDSRTPLWDNLRFSLIFLVILGHIADYCTGQCEYARILFFYIYTFHMPAFIFVSGMFCKNTVNSKNYERIFSYVVLYFFIKFLLFLSGSFLYKDTPPLALLSEGGVPWYAFALFAFCLLTIFLKRFNPVYVLIFSIVLACFAGYDSSLDDDKLVLLRIITYFPFFFSGYLLKPEKLLTLLKKKAVIAAAFVIMAGLAVAVYFNIETLYDLRPLLSGRNPYSFLTEQYADYGGLLRAAYYVVAFVLIGCVIALTPHAGTFVTPFGSRTVQAYSLHIVLLRIFAKYAAEPLMRLVGAQSFIFVIDLVAISLIVTAVCSLKIFEKPFAVLLSPGKAKTE